MLRALLPWLRIIGLVALLVAVFVFEVRQARAGASYDINALRAPRADDVVPTDWPTVIDPLRLPPRSELVLCRSDGAALVSFPPPAWPDRHKGAMLDPALSFDAGHVYFAWFPDVTPTGRNPQRRGAPVDSRDLGLAPEGTLNDEQLPTLTLAEPPPAQPRPSRASASAPSTTRPRSTGRAPGSARDSRSMGVRRAAS